ncbi:MAG: methylated-DNA--[protein]-cysteine S-methyltransferase [Armatimonadetes bacterium]|nr:methylated-DNA--[protein]-cysteine S-methyltransferase [Armatimonadota bacterium]
MSVHSLPTPFGQAIVVLNESGAVTKLTLGDIQGAPELTPDHPVYQQLAEYFAGKRTEFDLKLAPSGTPFQQEVWAALREIPFGLTKTYGEIAKGLGKPDAIRAVGRANALNPIWILIPCHRVIGASGSLTGYAGGLSMKQGLLELESRQRSLF